MTSPRSSPRNQQPTLLEWWPDYGGDLLHVRTGPGGVSVDLLELPLSTDLKDALKAWVGNYSDDRVPGDGPGDPAWISEGAALLARCRTELSPGYEVVVTEPWWGESASE